MREYEILMLLREAYRFIGRENRRGYQRCMEQAKAAIDAMPKSRALRGEWLLISAISCPSDLDRLCVLFREAAELMEGHSRVLPHCAPLYDDYGAFAVCNKQPGHAEENIEKLAEAVRLFYGLTGGAMATDVCYRAQVTTAGTCGVMGRLYTGRPRKAPAGQQIVEFCLWVYKRRGKRDTQG